MQSLEMGQKSCRLVVQKGAERGELYFAGGQCRDARSGDIEGDDAVYRVVLWTEGEFEIDFNAANASTRTSTTRTTTGLLMEAMRLMDEASRDEVRQIESAHELEILPLHLERCRYRVTSSLHSNTCQFRAKPSRHFFFSFARVNEVGLTAVERQVSLRFHRSTASHNVGTLCAH